jgi:hypothetical protein
MRLLPLALVVAALGLSACGSSSDDSASSDDPQQAIRGLFSDAKSALDDGRYDDMCGLMTKATQDEVASAAGGSCADSLKQVFDKGGADALPLDVESIDVQAPDKAMVHSPDDRQTKVVRQDGAWRFAADSDF